MQAPNRPEFWQSRLVSPNSRCENETANGRAQDEHQSHHVRSAEELEAIPYR